MRYLKQNTDQYVTVGPFLDKTAGLGNEDGLTVTSMSGVICRSTQSGASAHTDFTPSATAENDWGMAAIGHGGMYDLKIPDSEINFVGSCTIAIWYDAEALPVWHEFQVVPANVWDSLMGTDIPDVSVTQWNGTNVHSPAVAGLPVVQLHGTGSAGVDAPTNFEDLAITDTTGLVSDSSGVTELLTRIPDATAGANGGLTICGSNAATTFATLTVTGELHAGSIHDAGTLVIDGATTLTGAVSAVTVGITALSCTTLTAVTNAIAWNAAWDTEVESECQDALIADNLDHLMKTAVANNADMTAEVTDGTVLSNLMSKASDTSTFAVGTDSLEALRDRGDAAWVTATSVTVSDKTGFSLANASIVTATFGTCDLTSTMKTSVTTAASAATPAVTVSDKTGFSLANGSIVTATFGTCDLTSTMKTSVTTAASAATPTVTVSNAGMTAGGTYTFAKLVKILAAGLAGQVKDKSGSAGVYQVLDAEDQTTVILEITPAESTPYKSVTIS